VLVAILPAVWLSFLGWGLKGDPVLARGGRHSCAMTNTTSLVIKQKPRFPALFAVWRPHLNRWQFCRPLRDGRGEVVGFRSVWRPTVSAEFMSSRTSGAKREVLVSGRNPVLYWQVGAFYVEELEDRGLVERKIPAFEFGCWRSLPRPGL
jgi:hypothetical protein